MEITEVKNIEGVFGIVVMDGNRVVARARRVLNRGWIVTGYGVSFLDKPGGPLAPNAFGNSDPSRFTLRNVNSVRKFFSNFTKGY